MTCRICFKAPDQAAQRVVGGRIVERCVCSCHDEHLVHPSAQATFVRAARKSGLSGKGIGFGAGTCNK